MTGLTTIGNQKGAHITRALMLPSHTSIPERELDHRCMDTSPAHQAYMRDRLYGQKKSRKDMLTENGVSDCMHNYADEIPAPWKSTSIETFVPKVGGFQEQPPNAAKVAGFINQTHFSLGGYDGNDQKSVTREDYAATAATARYIPTSRHCQAQVSTDSNKAQHYSPITGGEDAAVPFSSTYKQSFTAGTEGVKSKIIPTRREYVVPSAAEKSRTHFTMGNDKVVYETVSQRDIGSSAYFPSEPVSCSTNEKRISNVLDNPDGEAGNRISVQKQDYSARLNIPRESIVVDNSDFVSELKATHFSIGNGVPSSSTSEYKKTFAAPPKDYGRATRYSYGDATGENSRVLAGDQDYRKTAKSCNSLDFVAHPVSGFFTSTIKKSENNSDVSFGDRRIGGLAAGTRSVTQADFDLDSIQKASPYCLYKARPTLQHNPLHYENEGEKVPLTPSAAFTVKRSVTAESFGFPISVEQIFKETSETGNQNRVLLRKQNTSLGTDVEGGNGLSKSVHASDFTDPQVGTLQVDNFSRKLKQLQCFAVTGENTINRNTASPTWKAVNSSVYGHFPFKPEISRPTPVYDDCLDGVLAPQRDAQKPIRDLTTVARQSYVAPINMRFINEL